MSRGQPDYDEAHRQGDEKLRQLGWTLLLLWTFVICWITKEYWFPGLFTNRVDENSNIVSRIRQWRDRSREKKLQRVNDQVELEKKKKRVELLQKVYSDPEAYYFKE